MTRPDDEMPQAVVTFMIVLHIREQPTEPVP
jgi:hypothetical protein